MLIPKHDIIALLKDTSIIGTNDELLAQELKAKKCIKRYKIISPIHTDREIKTKGKEIINLGKGLYGIVTHYQNIPLYEAIDFQKPGRSMQVGMMPAKLTHILINIGLSYYHTLGSKNQNLIIYDPFVGSGTTGFLTNFMGYDFI